MCPASSLLQRGLLRAGEEPRRHRDLQEGDGRLVRHAGARCNVERLRVQRGGAASCGEGDGGLPQICECLNQGGVGIYFYLFFISGRSDSHPNPLSGRPSDTRTTPSTPSTACVRCYGTRWSLRWASRCRRRRPSPRSGNGPWADCRNLRVEEGVCVSPPCRGHAPFVTLCVTVLQRGFGPAGVLSADPGAAAGQEGGPTGAAGSGRRRHHHGCQIWAVSQAHTHAFRGNGETHCIRLLLQCVWCVGIYLFKVSFSWITTFPVSVYKQRDSCQSTLSFVLMWHVWQTGFAVYFQACHFYCFLSAAPGGFRREYPPTVTPKMFLLEWSRKEKLEQPVYHTVWKTSRVCAQNKTNSLCSHAKSCRPSGNARQSSTRLHLSQLCHC